MAQKHGGSYCCGVGHQFRLPSQGVPAYVASKDLNRGPSQMIIHRELAVAFLKQGVGGLCPVISHGETQAEGGRRQSRNPWPRAYGYVLGLGTEMKILRVTPEELSGPGISHPEPGAVPSSPECTFFPSGLLQVLGNAPCLLRCKMGSMEWPKSCVTSTLS